MAADLPDGQAQPVPPASQQGAQPERPALEQDFTGDVLFQLRAAVAAHASAAGLTPSRVYDVVAAAQEMAANAVRHGAGHGRLRLHSDGLVLYCQVSDDGKANHEDPGHQPGDAAPWPVQHGHGLWLISQVADQFTIDHGPEGTTTLACFTLNPAAEAPESQAKERPPGR